MSLAIQVESHLVNETEYLLSEMTSEIKREYIDGQIYAMSGAGYNHNCIALNISANFRLHLKSTPCNTFISDMKLKLGKDYVYPDVMVDCSSLTSADYFSTAPLIVIEVLSPSTRKKDLTYKLLRYINLPSLEELVLIEQDIVSVLVMRRSNNWLPEYFFLGDTVMFDSIKLYLTVEEIYDRVDNAEMREFKQQQLATS